MTALDDMKAVNVKLLDVRGRSDIADAMIVASGNSDRHVRAIAEHVLEKARDAGRRPMGVEGRRDSEWVLVDLQDVLVHVMLPRVREFYALEQLWEPASPEAPKPAAKHPGKSAGKTSGRAPGKLAAKAPRRRRPPARSAAS